MATHPENPRKTVVDPYLFCVPFKDLEVEQQAYARRLLREGKIVKRTRDGRTWLALVTEG